jgi:hypothetical protein
MIIKGIAMEEKLVILIKNLSEKIFAWAASLSHPHFARGSSVTRKHGLLIVELLKKSTEFL